MKTNYQVVILENPGLNWDDKITQTIFAKIVKLKIDGYQFEYGQNVMPVGVYDFFGTHILLCESENGELNPLSIAKISKYSLCKYFNQSFPPIELARKGGNDPLAIEIENILKEVMQSGKDITYDSSWTLRPDLRCAKQNPILLRIMSSLWINYHVDNSLLDFIVSATLKVKSNKLFFASGCIPVMDNPYYKLLEVNNEDAMMFRSGKLSKLILKNAEKYKDLWKNRLTYGTMVN